MCTNINVTLPTVVSFLLLYSLRCGCVVILVWTMIRAVFFLGFFVVAMIEVFLSRPPYLGRMFPVKPEAPTSDEDFFIVYMSFLIMIVAECLLFTFLIYLMIGLYYDSQCRIEQYLICRFITWTIETLALVVLSLTHDSIIGWYLGFLMIIILELYGFIVVYSYYVDMDEDDCKDPQNDDLDDSGMIETQTTKSSLCPC